MLRVFPPEAGEKLLRFLERRLSDAPPTSVLHRWIRTGQVRVNGGRAKPFTLLQADDEVRVPPFAVPRPVLGAGPSYKSTLTSKGCAPTPKEPADKSPSFPDLGTDLPIVALDGDVLVLAKPAGLAVQPGTGQSDSVVDRLRAAFAEHAFIPAPVHRLDAPTSGLLLVALSRRARTELHAAFAQGGIRKEYLAWAAGVPASNESFVMHDYLEKQADAHGFERMAQSSKGSAGGKEALAEATPLRRLSTPLPAALLLIHLHTGRTHQIRSQLALRGLPLVGDRKYGGPAHSTLLLHCFRLTLPDGRSFELPPPWPAPYALS